MRSQASRNQGAMPAQARNEGWQLTFSASELGDSGSGEEPVLKKSRISWDGEENQWVIDQVRAAKDAGEELTTCFFRELWERGVKTKVVNEHRNPESLRTLARMEGLVDKASSSKA
eukprot:5515688-Amphidinium_carterae.1